MAMADERANYAGLAAAAVLLVGLLIVGNTATRIGVSGVIIFVVALVVVPTGSLRFVVVAIGVAVCSAWVAYKAASCELTGKATYCTGRGRWGLRTEEVTREASPVKFRQAANNTWAGSLFLALVSAGCFMFRWKLESSEDLP